MLSELLKLSLTPPPKEKLDINVVGESYRHHVRENVWSKALIPSLTYQVVNEMTKKNNIERFEDPIIRYDHIVGGMKHSKHLKSVVTVKESVLQLCLLHWQGSR